MSTQPTYLHSINMGIHAVHEECVVVLTLQAKKILSKNERENVVHLLHTLLAGIFTFTFLRIFPTTGRRVIER